MSGAHNDEPENGGRSGCFCCSATHECASASLLTPEYLPARGTDPIVYAKVGSGSNARARYRLAASCLRIGSTRSIRCASRLVLGE